MAVDDDGIWFPADADDGLCNLHFDGRRIWSFWSRRDGVSRDGRHLVAWPQRLVLHLEGTTQVRIDAGDGTVLYDQECRLGTKDRRLTVVDRTGAPLGIDYSGKLVKTFETKQEGQLEPLLDALESVLEMLHDEGLEAFPAYGTLLGAVRDGAFIGHDSDADVGYVSRHTHPIDVIRESHRVQRAVQQRGYATARHSGAAFKIDVPDVDGSVRGLDVFGGFFLDDHLALMGEVWAPYRQEWIFPLGTTTLEGRTFPAPAAPERLLKAMYGPGWRVPDPAFKYEKDPAAQRRFDRWFRGTRVYRAQWDHRYGLAKRLPPTQRPHSLTEVLQDGEDPETWVLDLGCGRGRDSRWLARQGRQVVGLDFSEVALGYVRRQATEQHWPLELYAVNLLELRQTLAWGAALAARPGPRTILARHLIDSLPPHGVDNFWRLVSMVLADGGRLYVEFLLDPITDERGRRPLTEPLDPDEVIAGIRRRGGVVAAREDLVNEPIDYGYAEEVGTDKHWRTCRLVVDWPAQVEK